MQQLIETLNKVFKGKHTGAYLDIGAYDGVTNNVTHWFYQHGWRGICIEPQTKYFKMGKAERPEDTWIKGVVVDKEHTAKTIVHFDSPTSMKRKLKAIHVNSDVILPEQSGNLDLLVINPSGEHPPIITTIDLGQWKPNIVVTPTFNSAKIIQHMQTMGYYQLAPDKTGGWLVFSNDYGDSNAL